METLMIQLKQVQSFQNCIPIQIPYLSYPPHEETTNEENILKPFFNSQITGN
jgi:hypothetical protein